MQIASDFDSAEWNTLKLDDPASHDWETAVTVLERRIRERYIDPVDFLIAAENEKPATKRRFGFTVLAIDCLLVEALGSFLGGLEDTNGRSRDTFCKFLTTQPQFSHEFSQDLAEQFYYEFRCGVLHQAEIGGNSKVWSIGPLVQRVGRAIIINRNEFHKRLSAEFASYLQQLRSPANAELRTNFRRKMDFIARE